ncbi:alkaline phosphatase family protein [Thalassotalea marina]|nr:ectonucleotide pyrophosphatase/phosphodiesterase [Thalassotalea marina]
MFKFYIIAACILTSFSTFAKNPIILISIDGFAHKYLTMYKPPFISSLSKDGVISDGLKPVYPSKTFPNHISIVTGKYPAEHGIVHNKFYHRKLQENYKLGAGANDNRWLTAEPIWTIAEKHGIKTGVYFWPESEAKVSGIYPSYYFQYKHNTPNKDRLDKLVEWLKLPEPERPNLVITYFSTVDSAGHKYGTTSVELQNAIKELDALLASFFHRIEQETDLTPNILLVSDHGMVDIDSNVSILTKTLLQPFPQLRIVNGETQLYIYESNKNTLEQVKTHLTSVENSNHYKVYLAKDFPKHWQFGDKKAGIPDMIVEAIPPSVFVKPDFQVGKGKLHKGTHGFDALGNNDLDAIFIAKGPNINKGIVLPKFQNILVFDLMVTLLELEREITPGLHDKEIVLFQQIIKTKSEQN